MPRFAGIVQGVVVQMSTLTCRPASAGTLRCQASRIVRRERKLDVDRGRRVVLVLDLGFGEGRAVAQAPVHGLLALVHEAAVHELPERSDDRGLIARRHREVGMCPVPGDAQPLEVVALRADEPFGVLAARAAEVRQGAGLAAAAEVLFDVELDRQPVAVPSGHVRRVEPRHRAGLDDEVLQDLVQRVADVNVAVGVRRTIVQHVLRRAARRARICSYRRMSSQRAITAGSVAGRFAFMGKLVRGRLSVSFQSVMSWSGTPRPVPASAPGLFILSEALEGAAGEAAGVPSRRRPGSSASPLRSGRRRLQCVRPGSIGQSIIQSLATRRRRLLRR